MHKADRRTFMSTVTKVVGSSLILSNTRVIAMTEPTQTWTVGQIMDLFISEVPGAPFSQTVDTLKAGSRDLRVTGIVTTMFATIEVIRKAIDLKANFIVAHEPTYYNHLDDTSWLSEDPIYRYKADLLAKHNIAVWRNHDYVHRLRADGVFEGVTQQLKWENFRVQGRPVFELQPAPLRSIIAHLKTSLGISTVRYIGDLSASCGKVLLMPGASGGRNQITLIAREKPDLIVCGEISEWETAEYVRDARSKGDNISLVILGHVASEEPGSKFLADWFTEKVKGIKTTHVPAGNSLSFA
jgi:putative NIF3 family GTP cyclohydrolase 1 type 2